jgi:hypothetical protein
MLKMEYINRSAAVIKPQQPFLEWLNALPDSDIQLTLRDIQQDCTVLLLPEFDDENQNLLYIKNHFNLIFEKELDGFCIDSDYWPQKRDYKTFLRWFEIEIHSAIIDTVGKDIIKEILE